MSPDPSSQQTQTPSTAASASGADVNVAGKKDSDMKLEDGASAANAIKIEFSGDEKG